MIVKCRFFLQQLGFGAVSLITTANSRVWAAPARSVKLPRSLPGTRGVAAEGLLNFVNAIETENLNVHSLMVLRHGQMVAEGWWNPYSPDLKHTLYSLSKSFTSTAVGMAVAEGKLSADATGQTVLAYLRPRLFAPLGIEGADWEVDPNGINTGGWGLRVRTEDIAKFGQLYL